MRKSGLEVQAVEGTGRPARSELARGTVELATLAVLSSRRRYGYELLVLLNEMTGGFPEIKEGTLYPLLHRLEDAGYITSNWETEGRTPPRKYYVISSTGRGQLRLLRREWSRLVEGMQRVLESPEGAKS
jgi:PadR family transcriptional regulator, regulatory protein PadR